jgi:hypothetical protein
MCASTKKGLSKHWLPLKGEHDVTSQKTWIFKTYIHYKHSAPHQTGKQLTKWKFNKSLTQILVLRPYKNPGTEA